ncbi:methyltransferase family protein [Solirhodobacter olei]|uniref:methyltransferase family protein n=1 Tax=Solirhodobacter olei TaxID=2493082 RepID=UPI000FD6D570|nr:isoprenylcysteine carboxylmethyltransferase family protein [Solirhodobacter olei]
MAAKGNRTDPGPLRQDHTFPDPARVADTPARTAGRILLVVLAETALIAGLLLSGAGTFDWEWAWVLLAVAAASFLPAVAVLAVHAPGLLASRTQLAPPDQPLADRIFVPAHSALMLGWAWVVGRDAGHIHWWTVPTELRVMALLLIPAITWAGYRTMRDNPYLAPCVCLQEERAHRVVDTGAYALVRHPFYSVAIAYQLCASLVLGSVIGVAITAMVGMTLALRIGIEERFLEGALPGYSAYKRATPWRLIPGLW